jgi:beta-glucanase (GH16 family)
LRTFRNPDFSSCGEVQAKEADVYHASIRISARVRGDPGGVAGMFTYFNDSTESDTEILTGNATTLVQYTNQPDVDSNGHTIAAAGTTSTLPNDGAWTAWNVYRLDWLPASSNWYINDMFVANKTYGVPKYPSYLVMNMVSFHEYLAHASV